MKTERFQNHPEETTLASEKTKEDFLRLVEALARGVQPTPGRDQVGNEVFGNYYSFSPRHEIDVLTSIPQKNRPLGKDEVRACVIERRQVGKEMPSFVYTLRGDGNVYYAVDAYNAQLFNELKKQREQAALVDDQGGIEELNKELVKVAKGAALSVEIGQHTGVHLVTEAELADLNVLLEVLLRESEKRPSETQ